MARYSVATSMWGDQTDFDTVVGAVRSAGFSQCELWAPACRFDRVPPAELRRSLNRHAVRARTIHPPISGTDLAALDEDDRKRSVADIGACFEPFAELGGFAVIIHPSGSNAVGTGERAGSLRDAIRRSLDALAEKAGRLGIRLACENLQLKGVDRVLCRMDELRAVIDDYPEHVGICLDTGHANNNGLEPAREARSAGERLIALHLQDTDAQEDRHWTPGKGSVNWSALLAALTEIGFDGARTFELSARDSDPLTIAHEARRVADAWVAGRP
jgi:sugar phosphate isomerase/epimerase